jgi:GAF domain-containing protein
VALTVAFVCATAAVLLLAGQELRRRGRGAQRLQRLNDLYAALSRTNQGVLRLRDEQPLLDELCRICVDTGHALFAVVMRLDAEGRPEVAACAGPAEAVALARQGMAEVARSPGTRTHRALHDGEASFVQDYAVTPHVVSDWRRRTLALGVRGIAALPIRVDGAPHASLSVFVAEQQFFDAEVRALLTEVADDVAFALQTMRREVERRQAMQEVQAAATRLQDVFNGMALPAAILSTTDAHAQDVNGAFCAMPRSAARWPTRACACRTMRSASASTRCCARAARSAISKPACNAPGATSGWC